jgi:hypothetical protein
LTATPDTFFATGQLSPPYSLGHVIRSVIPNPVHTLADPPPPVLLKA